MSPAEFNWGFLWYMCRSPSYIKSVIPHLTQWLLSMSQLTTSSWLEELPNVCQKVAEYVLFVTVQKNLQTVKCHIKQCITVCASQEYPLHRGHRVNFSTVNLSAGSTVKHQHYNLIALVTLKIHYKSARFRLSWWWLWRPLSCGMWHLSAWETGTNISGEHIPYQLHCITSLKTVIFTNLQIFKISSQYMC